MCILQAVRNLDDLECLACPPKYRELKSFYKYYTGQLKAPYLTIFSAHLTASQTRQHAASSHKAWLAAAGHLCCFKSTAWLRSNTCL